MNRFLVPLFMVLAVSIVGCKSEEEIVSSDSPDSAEQVSVNPPVAASEEAEKTLQKVVGKNPEKGPKKKLVKIGDHY